MAYPLCCRWLCRAYPNIVLQMIVMLIPCNAVDCVVYLFYRSRFYCAYFLCCIQLICAYSMYCGCLWCSCTLGCRGFCYDHTLYIVLHVLFVLIPCVADDNFVLITCILQIIILYISLVVQIPCTINNYEVLFLLINCNSL